MGVIDGKVSGIRIGRRGSARRDAGKGLARPVRAKTAYPALNSAD
jgi:hypothetical protein